MERKKKKLIYNVVVSHLLITGLVRVCSHFVHLGNVAYTDNAQVKQLIVPVNSRVQGFIKKIYNSFDFRTHCAYNCDSHFCFPHKCFCYYTINIYKLLARKYDI